MKEQEHIPGRPIYSVRDFVSFQMIFDENVETFDGTIEIVDGFGVLERESEITKKH